VRRRMGRGWPGSLGHGSGVGRAMSIVRRALLFQPLGIAGASKIILAAHKATTGAVERGTDGERPASGHQSTNQPPPDSLLTSRKGVGWLCVLQVVLCLW
jgi:hypothetical protein